MSGEFEEAGFCDLFQYTAQNCIDTRPDATIIGCKRSKNELYGTQKSRYVIKVSNPTIIIRTDALQINMLNNRFLVKIVFSIINRFLNARNTIVRKKIDRQKVVNIRISLSLEKPKRKGLSA